LPFPAGGSPHWQPQRPSSPAAGVPAHRQPFSFNQARKTFSGQPLVNFPAFPGQDGDELDRIFLPAPATAPRGDIAKGKVFSRACLQIGNSNSKAMLLILVNCVETRRKIRKMQTQFCWIRGEKSYNFR
jgi:hypothetical protein